MARSSQTIGNAVITTEACFIDLLWNITVTRTIRQKQTDLEIRILEHIIWTVAGRLIGCFTANCKNTMFLSLNGIRNTGIQTQCVALQVGHKWLDIQWLCYVHGLHDHYQWRNAFPSCTLQGWLMPSLTPFSWNVKT